MKTRRDIVIWFLLLVVVFAADRLLKLYFIKKSLTGFFIWEKFISFGLVENRGIAFGWTIGEWWQLIGGVVIFMILIWLGLSAWRQNKKQLVLWIGLIVVGGFSNLLDRLFFGAVIDYVSLVDRLVFNLADVAIVLGVLGWLKFLKK